MSKDDINHWEKKYSGDGYEPDLSPSALLTEWPDDRPPGSALDLACGTGRNALYLAGKGYAVSAIDSSPRAIELAGQAARERDLKINWIVADLDNYVIREQYDLIIISFFYPKKTLVPSIINALKKGGILLCENNMLSPSAPAEETRKHRFHLKPGELPQIFKKLKVIRYQERRGDAEGGRASYLAGLVAQKE